MSVRLSVTPVLYQNKASELAIWAIFRNISHRISERLQEIGIPGLLFAADSMGLSSFNFFCGGLRKT